MDDTMPDAERMYWEQRLGRDVPLNAVGYHGLSDTFVAWLYRIRKAVFLRTMAGYAREGMRVLDIGSGGGFYIGLWQQLRAGEIVASDLTQASLNALQRRYPDVSTSRFDIGADAPPYEDASFDAISCMDVLHHIMEDASYERAIRNCARLLKPGGVLVFTDNCLHGGALRGAHSVSRPLVHVEQMLRAAGFAVAARAPIFVLMNNPVDSRSALLRWYWKAMSYVSEHRVAGFLTGMLLYPVERVLTSILREGPSTEIVVAKRRP